MSELFKCPSCSASLEFDGGDHATVRCSYCGNTVIVPESMRSQAPNVTGLFTRSNKLNDIVKLINEGNIAEAIDLYARTFNVTQAEAQSAVTRLSSGLSLGMHQVSVQNVQSYSISTDPNIQTYKSTDNTGRTIGCIILFIVLFTVGIILVTTVVPLVIGGAAVSSIFSGDDGPLSGIDNVFSTIEASSATVESTSGSTTLSGRSSPTPPPVIAASPTPSVGNLIQVFGSEGIAPGQLNDARTLAIDPAGNIYVADRNSGRLQIFDPQGNVQTQWQMSEDRYIDNMTIDRAGHLYTVESSDIYRYDLATGQQLNQITYPGSIVAFKSVAATADNQLVAVNWIAGQIIRFDSNGNSNLVIQVEDVADATGFDFVTVDGSGNIYAYGKAEDALGNPQDVVFKFNSDGQYITRFGKTGSEPGTFRSAQAIAVDGLGRIYVGDFFGVHIFDSNGAFLDFFPVDGVVFDMKFNDRGELLITNRTSIFRFTINLK